MVDSLVVGCYLTPKSFNLAVPKSGIEVGPWAKADGNFIVGGLLVWNEIESAGTAEQLKGTKIPTAIVVTGHVELTPDIQIHKVITRTVTDRLAGLKHS